MQKGVCVGVVYQFFTLYLLENIVSGQNLILGWHNM